MSRSLYIYLVLYKIIILKYYNSYFPLVFLTHFYVPTGNTFLLVSNGKMEEHLLSLKCSDTLSACGLINCPAVISWYMCIACSSLYFDI